MSEKRFERWNDYSCKVKDNQEGILLNWEDVINKLNEQQDIIGEQKIAIDELITDYKKLEGENEQLQKENKRLKKRNDESEDELEESSAFIIEQREENKQLRKQLDFYLLDEFEWEEKYGDCDKDE